MDVDADNYLVLTSQLAVQRRQAGREGGRCPPSTVQHRSLRPGNTRDQTAGAAIICPKILGEISVHTEYRTGNVQWS